MRFEKKYIYKYKLLLKSFLRNEMKYRFMNYGFLYGDIYVMAIFQLYK